MSVILKGKIRGNSKKYVPYLLQNQKNEKVRIFDIGGTAFPDNAADSLYEIGAYEYLTRSEKAFLQVIMNFDAGHNPTDEEWQALINRVEKAIGFEGQPFVHVMHLYEGKWHMHANWGRYDYRTGNMKPIDHIGLDLKNISYDHAIEYEHEHLLKGQQERREKELEEQRLKEEVEKLRLLADEKEKLEIEEKFTENVDDTVKNRVDRLKEYYASQDQEEGQKHKL